MKELLDRRNELVTAIGGWEQASMRGNLTADEEKKLADMDREIGELDIRIETLWIARTPDEIAAYDARIDRGNFDERIRKTRSPERTYDAWAIWMVLSGE